MALLLTWKLHHLGVKAQYDINDVIYFYGAPLSTTLVDLLGSWDNFTKPYPMQRDLRTGRGHWRGIHSFQNIICDGNPLATNVKRDGGLKMGGKYWYYYRLNDDIEYCDPGKSFTMNCPLLPGQAVNVLEVPMESKLSSHHNRSRSSSSVESAYCTLNPEDRYLTPGMISKASLPRRAKTISLLPKSRRLSTSTPSTDTSLICQSLQNAQISSNSNPHENALDTSEAQSYDSFCESRPAPRRVPLRAVLHSLRSVRSACANKSQYQDKEGGQLHTSPISDKVAVEEMYSLPSATDSDYNNDSIVTSKHADHPTRLPQTVSTIFGRAIEMDIFSSESFEKPDMLFMNHDVSDLGQSRIDGLSYPTERDTSLLKYENIGFPLNEAPEETVLAKEGLESRQSQHLKSIAASVHPRDISNVVSGGHVHPSETPLCEIVSNSRTLLSTDNVDRNSVMQTENAADPLSGVGWSCRSSYITDVVFSPSLTSATAHTGSISPFFSSQPQTPSISEFGDFLDSSLNADILSGPSPTSMRKEAGLYYEVNHDEKREDFSRKIGGFDGYQLPEEEQASALTLRQLPTAFAQSHGPESPFEKKSGQDLVHSWNDGSEHRLTATEELFKDLGYLGGMIE